MDYKLIITERAQELLDHLVYHLLLRFKSEQAAEHLLDEISGIYNRIKNNPFQFPVCRNEYLKRKKYREAVLPNMNYLVIFKVEGYLIFILGIFHQQEKYEEKL